VCASYGTDSREIPWKREILCENPRRTEVSRLTWDEQPPRAKTGNSEGAIVTRLPSWRRGRMLPQLAAVNHLHSRGKVSSLSRAAVIEGRDMWRLDRCFRRDEAGRDKSRQAGQVGHKTRYRRVFRDEARNPRMVRKEPGEARLKGASGRFRWAVGNLEEDARGLRCDKPRAYDFPNFGGGGPSLRLSLRSSSSSSRRCASVSLARRLAS
jgi:hypothetical protein